VAEGSLVLTCFGEPLGGCRSDGACTSCPGCEAGHRPGGMQRSTFLDVALHAQEGVIPAIRLDRNSRRFFEHQQRRQDDLGPIGRRFAKRLSSLFGRAATAWAGMGNLRWAQAERLGSGRMRVVAVPRGRSIIGSIGWLGDRRKPPSGGDGPERGCRTRGLLAASVRASRKFPGRPWGPSVGPAKSPLSGMAGKDAFNR